MDVDVLFAGVAVSDFATASDWYQRFFGRPPDVVAHEEEVMWHVANAGWLYILRDPERAGKSLVALAVPNIEDALSDLGARGLATGPVEAQGGDGQKAVVLDPDGNSLALIEVTRRAG